MVIPLWQIQISSAFVKKRLTNLPPTIWWNWLASIVARPEAEAASQHQGGETAFYQDT